MRYRDSTEDAVAMLNEGFFKIVKNLEKFRGEVPFEAWIRRIMVNTLIDDFRKNRRKRENTEHHDFTDTNIHAQLVNFNLADLAFDAEELLAMIKTLPPMSQKVFNLFAIDGYSHREIGEMLGITGGTSKWHLSFARQRLRNLLAKKSEAAYAKDYPQTELIFIQETWKTTSINYLKTNSGSGSSCSTRPIGPEQNRFY